MSKSLRHILLCLCLALLATAGFVSCDVHEFPDGGEGTGETTDFILHLDYTDALKWGFNTEIDYSFNRTPSLTDSVKPQDAPDIDVRYIVKAYRVADDGTVASEPSTVVTEAGTDTTQLNRSMKLQLAPGAYKILVWTDYVEHGTLADLYYDPTDFKEVTYRDREGYTGNNDLRQAFRGEVDAVVHAATDAVTNSATAIMQRPLAKFKFVSTDLEKFLAMVVMSRAGRAAPPMTASELEVAMSKINFSDFKIRFIYTGFLPCAFNVWTNRPCDSWTGITFDSGMKAISETDTELGHDLVLVNGHGSSVAVRLEVYDRDGTLLSSTNPIDVPLLRNKLTIVRGNFLTSKASGGVGVVTDFDGEYNYEVP